MEDFTHRINCFSFYDAEGFFKIQAFSKKVGMWLCVCGLNVGWLNRIAQENHIHYTQSHRRIPLTNGTMSTAWWCYNNSREKSLWRITKFNFKFKGLSLLWNLRL